MKGSGIQMKKNLEEMEVKAINKSAILESHDGEEFSLITVAKNVLCEDGTTMQDYFDSHSEPNISTKIVNSNSMSKVGQGDNVDFSDNVMNGAYEDVVLKGRSLVNIVDYDNREFNGNNTISNNGVITLYATGGYSNTFLECVYLKPNTKYLAIVDVLENTLIGEENARVALTSRVGSSTIEFNEDFYISIASGVGRQYKILRTVENPNCKWSFRSFLDSNSTGGYIKYKVMMIEYQEGMENWDIPYFTGLCDVKSPILTNLDANNEQSNTVTFDQKDGKTIVLRSLPNGVCDTLNVRTGEYVQNIGEIICDGSEDERWVYNIAGSGQGKKCFNLPSELTPHRKRFGYIICDCMPTTNTLDKIGVYNGEGLNILIDSDSNDVGVLKEILANKPITVQYELATPIVKQINVEGYPYAYENGHILLESGSQEQSLTPTIEYSIVANRGGQIRSNQRMVERHQKKLDSLYAMTLVNMIDSQYKQVLMKLKSELGSEVRTWDIE